MDANIGRECAIDQVVARPDADFESRRESTAVELGIVI